MSGRTYRYDEHEALYPFGYGLSYGKVEYLSFSADRENAYVELKNTGDTDTEEVVQIYISNNAEEKAAAAGNEEYLSAFDAQRQPKWSLCGFKRVSLKAGESLKLTLPLSASAFDTVLNDGRRVVLKGRYTLYAGGQQPDKRSEILTGKKCLEQEVVL